MVLKGILERAAEHVGAKTDLQLGEKLAPYLGGRPVPTNTIIGWRNRGTCEFRYLNALVEMCADADLVWLLTGKRATGTNISELELGVLHGRLQEAQLVRKELDERIRALLQAQSCDGRQGQHQERANTG